MLPVNSVIRNSNDRSKAGIRPQQKRQAEKRVRILPDTGNVLGKEVIHLPHPLKPRGRIKGVIGKKSHTESICTDLRRDPETQHGMGRHDRRMRQHLTGNGNGVSRVRQAENSPAIDGNVVSIMPQAQLAGNGVGMLNGAKILLELNGNLTCHKTDRAVIYRLARRESHHAALTPGGGCLTSRDKIVECRVGGLLRNEFNETTFALRPYPDLIKSQLKRSSGSSVDQPQHTLR